MVKECDEMEGCVCDRMEERDRMEGVIGWRSVIGLRG